MKMGYSGVGGNTHNVVVAIKNKYPDLDFSHFIGQAANKGQTKQSNPNLGNKEKYTLNEVFTSHSSITQKVLRGYVERHNVIPYRCSICGCMGE